MYMNTEILYWRTNDDWYEEDLSGKHIYRVKDTAPRRAKDSYELWLKYQEPRYTEEDLMK